MSNIETLHNNRVKVTISVWNLFSELMNGIEAEVSLDDKLVTKYRVKCTDEETSNFVEEIRSVLSCDLDRLPLFINSKEFVVYLCKMRLDIGE